MFLPFKQSIDQKFSQLNLRSCQKDESPAAQPRKKEGKPLHCKMRPSAFPGRTEAFPSAFPYLCSSAARKHPRSRMYRAYFLLRYCTGVILYIFLNSLLKCSTF